MGKDKERVPGRFVRTIKTALLTSKVGSSYLGGKLADAFREPAERAARATDRHLENAKRMAHTMAQLRGPMMKIGQLLSTHAEALPEQYASVLKTLQSS